MNDEIKKLRWACRRGMLELDVLLAPYLEQAYLALGEAKKANFRALLDQADQDLFDWLTNKKPAERKFVEVVADIRYYAEHRKR